MPEEIALVAGYAAKEQVTIVGPKKGRELKNVRVLGPCAMPTLGVADQFGTII
jgi:propanediol utilization protein